MQKHKRTKLKKAPSFTNKNFTLLFYTIISHYFLTRKFDKYLKVKYNKYRK